MSNEENKLQIRKLSEVELQEVRWLWYPYIPSGKITIIQGDPGEGKTTLALRLAAACSTGQALPGMEIAEPFNVIYQTAEDGLGDTIKPRLMEAGADQDRVLNIAEDVNSLTLLDERIEAAIVQTGARLMILDPIQGYLGGKVDMNRANEIRTVLKNVAAVAERTGCAIVLVGHLNKAMGLGQKEITRRLNTMQRRTPQQLHDERCGKANGKVYRWTYQSVKNILAEESYTGLLVNHRTETHGRSVTPVPEDEQYRHENFFPVIINREEWEQVQVLLKANAKPYRGNTASHRYAGLLTCGDCGSTFVPRIRCWNGNRRVEYLCKSYMHHGKGFCPSHRIRESELDARVQQYAEELRGQWTAEQAVLRRLHRLWEMKRPAIQAHIAELYDEIQRLEQEIDDLLLEKIQSGN